MSNVQNPHNPLDDGVTFINVYTKGRTRLGRLLTNPADLKVYHKKYGWFRTAEGLWYYLRTGCKHEVLRTMSGFEAKALGKTLEVVWNQDFQKEFLKAIRYKVLSNEELKTLLRQSTLPLTHFYFYGSPYNDRPPKVIYPKGSEWQIEFFEELRRRLKRVDAWLVKRGVRELKRHLDSLRDD